MDGYANTMLISLIGAASGDDLDRTIRFGDLSIASDVLSCVSMRLGALVHGAKVRDRGAASEPSRQALTHRPKHTGPDIQRLLL